MSDHIWTHAVDRGFARPGPDGAEAPLLPAGPTGSGLVPAIGDYEPPADGPPAPPAAPGEGPSPYAPRLAFLSALFITQFGIEAMGLIVPQLANAMSSNFFAVSVVSTASFIAMTLGSLIGGPLVDRTGVRPMLLSLFALRVVSSTALAALYFAGALNLPALAALFALDYFFLGASRVTEAVFPTVLHGSDPIKVSRFSTLQQMVIEVVGILGPIAAGALVFRLGFGSILALYPVLFLAGTATLLLWLRLAPRPRAPSAKFRFKLSRVWEVLSLFLKNRALGLAALGLSVNTLLGYSLYFLVAPAYGLFWSKAPGAAAETQAWMTSLYAAGGLTAAWIMSWLSALSDRRVSLLPEAERAAESRSTFLRSASLWLALGGLAMLGAWLLPSTVPVLGLVPAYLFIVPFGVAATMIYLHLETVVKSEAPAEVRGTVLGVLRAFTDMLTVAVLLSLGWLFEAHSAGAGAARVPQASAFAILASVMTLLTPFYLALALGLRASSRKP